MKVKEESEKGGLKLNIWKTKIMASDPITSWQIAGETMETVRDFTLWAPKSLQVVTAVIKLKDTCTLEEKPWPTSTVYKKQRHNLQTKVRLVKAMVFPVVMYGCESWTIKKAEHWRIDGFELWSWRRLLRVLGLQGDQSILKEISPEYSMEGLMLKLKLLILWPPDAKNWLIGKDPDAGKYWRQEEKGTTVDEMVRWHHWLSGHEFE